MATTAYEIVAADGWVEVAPDAVDFMLEPSDRAVYVTFADAPPPSVAPYHIISRREILVRSGAGAVYVRNPDATAAASVVVTA